MPLFRNIHPPHLSRLSYALGLAALAPLLLAQNVPATQPSDPAAALPPISIKLKDANPAQLAEVLSAQLQLPITLGPASRQSVSSAARGHPTTTPTGSITLEAEAKPFWDILGQLSKDQRIPLTINGRPYPPVANYFSQGPFLAQVHSLKYAWIINPQGDEEFITASNRDNPNLALELYLAADPRLPIIAINAGLNSATDELNNTYLDKPITHARPGTPDSLRNIQLKIPPKPGTTLTLNGTAEFILQVSQDHILVPNTETQRDPIVFAGVTFRVTTTQGGNSVTINASPNTGNPFPLSIQYTLTDPVNSIIATRTNFAAGRLVIDTRQPALAPNQPQPPLQLKISIPKETKTLLFPYQLKNIPVPIPAAK